jgi:hypothetical protein
MTRYLALSLVSPNGKNIATGKKTLEIRSWQPPALPIIDLLIVENQTYLTEEGQVDPDGKAVALVNVRRVEPWQQSQVAAACSTNWQPGYFAWHLENVRPISSASMIVAARKLYEVEAEIMFGTYP